MIHCQADPDPANMARINDLFLSILPALQRRITYLTRSWPPPRQQETLAEASAMALAACHNLFRRKQIEKIHTTGFREYILKALRQGRCFADAPANGDVLAPNGRRRHGRCIYSLDARPRQSGHQAGSGVGRFADMLSDSKQSVMDQVAFRIDFDAWLTRLPESDRRMMVMLASGETPSAVASSFKISRAAVSQRRRKWRCQWAKYIAT